MPRNKLSSETYLVFICKLKKLSYCTFSEVHHLKNPDKFLYSEHPLTRVGNTDHTSKASWYTPPSHYLHK